MTPFTISANPELDSGTSASLFLTDLLPNRSFQILFLVLTWELQLFLRHILFIFEPLKIVDCI